VILYLTYWYPARYRAIIVGIFMVAIPAAGFIGSPLSGAILYLDGWLSPRRGGNGSSFLKLRPPFLLGLGAYIWLTDKPQNASWLTQAQQQWLISALDAERTRVPRVPHQSVWRVISNKYVLLMALVYAGAVGASTSLALWMPQLVKSFGLTNWQTGLVTRGAVRHLGGVHGPVGAAPPTAAAKRVWHNALPLAWMVVAMLLAFLAIGSLWGDDSAPDPHRCRYLLQQGGRSGRCARSGSARGAAAAGARANQRTRQPVRLLLQRDDRVDPVSHRQLSARHAADRDRGNDRDDLRAGDRASPATHGRYGVLIAARQPLSLRLPERRGYPIHCVLDEKQRATSGRVARRTQ